MRVFLFAGFLLLFTTQTVQSQKTYLIKAGKFYNSEKNIFEANVDILVKGDIIFKVGKNLKADSAEVVNLQNCTVSPGLIDAHTHILTIQKGSDPLEADVLMNSDIERTLRAVKIARQYLESGFTTIRDLGNSGMYLDMNIKRAIMKGWVIGPRMMVSGPILAPEDGQFFNLSSQNRFVIDREYTVIKNIEDARQAVKDHISHGVDLIKIVMGDGKLILSVDEVKAIVATAHEFGMKVTAHATYDKVIAIALEAGVDGIEHGYNISDSLLDIMAKKKVYLVPTIGTIDLYKEFVSPEHQTAEYIKDLEDWTKKSQDIVRKAIEKGVMVVNGCDMYLETKHTQGDAAKNSIAAYYAGVGKANEILKTATKNGAIALGLDRWIGTIKENMKADIVAFDGDMEKTFASSLYKIDFVMKNGDIIVNKSAK